MKVDDSKGSAEIVIADKNAWTSILDTVQRANLEAETARSTGAFGHREIVYFLEQVRPQSERSALKVAIGWRERRLTGEWSDPRFTRIQQHEISRLPDPSDRLLLQLLLNLSSPKTWSNEANILEPLIDLSDASAAAILPQLVATGRARAKSHPRSFLPDAKPLVLDSGQEWKTRIEARETSEKSFTLSAILVRGADRIEAGSAEMILHCGYFIASGALMKFDRTDPAAFALLELLSTGSMLSVPRNKMELLLKFGFENSFRIEWETPDAYRFEFVSSAPTRVLRLSRPKEAPARPDAPRKDAPRFRGAGKIEGRLFFDYAETIMEATDPRPRVVRIDERTCIERDRPAESEAMARLAQAGFHERTFLVAGENKTRLEIPAKKLPRVVTALIREGWRVEAEGKVFRSNSSFSFSVASGIDWFELEGNADFGGAGVDLPRLLEAFKRGENYVVLDDGSLGLLPEEWLRRFAGIVSLGETDKGRIRFRRSQALLLDAFLAEQPSVSIDAVFRKIRDELTKFDRIEPMREPDPFGVRLRSYQRWALGWFGFLRKFGFGGCLADDMGLGKTIMVLALLESRRADRKVRKPSLVVAPKSLIFNWRKEAARCAPKLRVLEHVGSGRAESADDFAEHDLVLTTYDLLARDMKLFKDRTFDYVILDEAQAAKNSMTARARAVRLLRSDHRLALTGTPIENHIGELWTMFEFLNPGMLGAASFLSRWAGSSEVKSVKASDSDAPDGQNELAAEYALLANVLRPFILRRTKAQVLKSLPLRTEQTVYCEMEPRQRRQYDQLRDHYRAELVGQIDRHGMGGSGMIVIEALLRLRQVACHPGLMDRRRAAQSSAKLDLLMPMIEEGLAEGRKALLFSQFTSHLEIVRRRLDRKKLNYEYLDGQTTDRQKRVEHFQSDPECRLFLISLKAGGVGLNLTSADLVFILDPWWNPAAESQAIDRAHRIGQSRSVLARRLITRGTVEEKVLELQDKKRGLASAVLGQDARFLKNMSRSDLDFLLSDGARA